jgi:predicted RNA methylase
MRTAPRSPIRDAPRSRPRETARHEGGRPLWLFLTEPGLAALALLELKFLGVVARKAQAAKLHLRNHDLLVLPDAVVKQDKAAPRMATNVLVSPVFGRNQLGAAQLDLLAHAFQRERADGLVTAIAGERFARSDFLPWVARELRSRGVRLADGSNRLAWFLAVDEKFYFGFPRFNHHDAQGRAVTPEREASLPAVIAAAMVFAAKPGRDEVIVDPVMGSGTILAEAAQMVFGAQLVGADIDPAAVALAKKSLARAPGARLVQQDSARASPGRSDVTLTLANLPFGKQHKSAQGNRALYEAILRRALEHAAASWRAVLLTSDEESLQAAVQAIGDLALSRIADVKVRGQDATIWSLRRS